MSRLRSGSPSECCGIEGPSARSRRKRNRVQLGRKLKVHSKGLLLEVAQPLQQPDPGQLKISAVHSLL